MNKEAFAESLDHVVLIGLAEAFRIVWRLLNHYCME